MFFSAVSITQFIDYNLVLPHLFFYSFPFYAEGAVYVWPQRLSDDGRAVDQHHYRHRRDVLWHPHPTYQLNLQVK